jgi:hypothetical protein
MKLQFKIEHIAINPTNPEKAKSLLIKLGLEDWIHDHVVNSGLVFGEGPNLSHLDLGFNYQAHPQRPFPDGSMRPLELEIMKYADGPNWMQRRADSVSHFGMHVTEDELVEYAKVFLEEGIAIAQETYTKSHQNPHIQNSRRYHYRIYDTHSILGVDLEFIVLCPIDVVIPAEFSAA